MYYCTVIELCMKNNNNNNNNNNIKFIINPYHNTSIFNIPHNNFKIP